MIKVQFLDKYIEEKLLAESKERDGKHISSGKLSASMLGQPTQWQILKVIGVPQDTREEYVIRKFRRGNDVEEWLLGFMEGIKEKQKFVEYKNVVGYVDAIVDMEKWNLGDFGFRTIPHEIKSVSNAKFKRIQKIGADKQHLLQACLYGMALGSKTFALDYVASDDYRVETYLYDTAEFEGEVEGIISAFNLALALKVVPEFKPTMEWHNDIKYNPYKEFLELNGEQLDNYLKSKYPDSYKKLKEAK